MSSFAGLSDAQRRTAVEEAAARLGILPVMVEKDYWVCWLLGRIFEEAEWAKHIVFKGGTTLSKVFGVIERFSEDIDLSVSPGLLGFAESTLDDAPSKGRRAKVFESLQDACADFVEVERTFWEKATILHAEYHRPVEKPMPDRFARHYSDFADLWRHPVHTDALRRLDLLTHVATFKSRFFASAWANYETACPGSLRLSPSQKREAELSRDFAKMAPMFLKPPRPFAELIEVLAEAQGEINAK